MKSSSGNKVPSSDIVLTGRLGSDLFAIPLASLEEVLPALPLDAIPGGAACWRGVVPVRGQLIPVLDVALRLGIKGHLRLAEPTIVCVRVDEAIVGLEFDEVFELTDLKQVQWLSSAPLGIEAEWILSVFQRDGKIVRLIDIGKLVHVDPWDPAAANSRSDA